MSKVVIIVESTGQGLSPASLPGIQAGQDLAAAAGGELHLLLLGRDVAAAAQSASAFAAAAVHTLQHELLEPATAEVWAEAIVHAAQQLGATALGGTATSLLRDVLPRVAARLDAPMASEVTEIRGASSFRREFSAGRALVDLELEGTPIVFTARASDFDAPAAGGCPVEALPAPTLQPAGVEVISLDRTESSRPGLTEADVVVSGGRGMREGKNFEILETLTDLLGGALGASRAATDAGMVPADLQVGQTGKVVAPKLYIAVAISGAIQHLAGMKGSKTIVAINKDPEAPIFQLADYGLVAKWEEAVPALIDGIKAHKGG